MPRRPSRSRASGPALNEAGRRRNRLVFGLPLAGSVDSEVVEFWLVHLNGRPFVSRKGQSLANAHNDMVRQVLELPARTLAWDYLVWLEHDHVFNAPQIFGYIERLDPKRVPVVSFLYVERRFPCLPVVYDRVGDACIQWGTTPEGIEKMRLADAKPGLYPVTGGVGMGCTAIHRSVLEALADDVEPWYHWAAEKTGEMTDDIWFCQRAIAAGFPVQVETRFDVGHMGKARYDRRHFWAGLAMQMPKVDLLVEEAHGPQAKVKVGRPGNEPQEPFSAADVSATTPAGPHESVGGAEPAYTVRDRRART